MIMILVMNMKTVSCFALGNKFGPYVSFFRARKKMDEEEGKVKK